MTDAPEMPLRCADCRAVGMLHCHDPEHCGGMQPSHAWVPARSVGLDRDWTVCRNCGVILCRDRANLAAACRGRVRVTLRLPLEAA